jgi:hypothetical protein
MEPEKPIGDVVREAIDASTLFIVKEMHLVRAEVMEGVQQSKKAAMFLVLGGVLATLGLIAVVDAVIAMISVAVPVWAAALLTAVLLMGLGGALSFVGVRALKTGAAAAVNRTGAIVKEDAKWLKKHLS